MSHSRKNYCEMIGLNPYQKYSDDQILSAIRDAKSNWERELKNSSIVSGRRYRLSEDLKIIPTMTENLRNPVAREEEFEKAKELVKKKLSGLLREAVVLTDGTIVIPPTAIDDLKKRITWNVIVTQSNINAALGNVRTNFEIPVPNPIKNAYRRMAEFDTYSPVEILNRIISIKQANIQTKLVSESTSPDELRQVCGEVYRRLENIKTNKIEYQDDYYSALRGVRGAIDTDESLELLNKYCLCKRIMEPATRQMDNDCLTRFSRNYIDNLLKTNIGSSGADLDLCTQILEEYCIAKRYPADFSDKNNSLRTCPRCNTLLFSDPNNFYCPECGSAVNSICPNCGRAQAATNEFCVACGIDIDAAIDAAKEKAAEIQDLVNSGKFAEASETYSDLSKEFPSFDPIPQIGSMIKTATEKIQGICAQIETDYMATRFFAIKKTVEGGLLLFPHLLDRNDIKARYEVACGKFSSADNLCVEAAKRSDEESREIYIQASELCPDHPECVAKLRNMPPDGPADAKFECTDEGISVTYSIPEDRRGVKFCIYRNTVYPPEVDQSTLPLVETDRWVFTDNTAESGIEYYYKIYSKRWGILSREYAVCGPAVLLNEVTDTKIEPRDDGLKITYSRPSGSSRVRVWRKASDSPMGEEDEIFHNDTGTIIDLGLQNGVLYHYLFVAEYEINGNTLRSNGTVASGRTADLPSPVEDLSVAWDKKHNCYTAEWTGPESTFLCYSLARSDLPEIHTARNVTSESVTPVSPLDSDDGKFRFELPVATVIYVYPITKIGNTYIRGKECIVADLRPFKDIAHSIEGQECRLTVSWPEGAEGFFAVVSGKDPEGNRADTEYTMSRTEYKSAGAFVFPLNGCAKTKVTVFAEYSIDGKNLRSIGHSLEVVKYDACTIRYTLSLEPVKGDRKVVRVKIKFSCDKRSNIPRCMMIASDGFLPLRMKDGKVIWESDDPTILLDGSTEASFVTPKENADLGHMRLFFADREMYNKCHFVHPIFRRN